MVDQHVEGRWLAVGEKERRGADTDDAARGSDGADHLVGGVARRVEQPARVGMGDDERPGRRRGGLERGPDAGMGEIDDDAELLHAADHLLAEAAQADVARLETTIANPIARIVGQLHDAQAGRMEDIEKIDLVLDRVGALEMKDDRGIARHFRGADLGDCARDADALQPRAVDLEPARHNLHGRAEILERAGGGEHGIDPALDDIGQALPQPPRLDQRRGGIEHDGRLIIRGHCASLPCHPWPGSAAQQRAVRPAATSNAGGASLTQMSCLRAQRGW